MKRGLWEDGNRVKWIKNTTDRDEKVDAKIEETDEVK